MKNSPKGRLPSTVKRGHIGNALADNSAINRMSALSEVSMQEPPCKYIKFTEGFKTPS